VTTAPLAAEQLRDRIAAAIASVTITIGPNSLALLEHGHTLGLTGGEIDAMALTVLAVVQPELDRMAAELDRVRAELAATQAACQNLDRVCGTAARHGA